MFRRKHASLWVMALVAVLALVVAACGGDDDDDAAAASDTTAASDTSATGGGGGGGVSGEITISGSSTVEPISNDVAKNFNESNPDVAISVSGPGTGDGFEQFCNGETDISDASRAIKEEEIAACADNGIDFIELKVGIDGLSVITSNANDQVECLSFADLYALLGPESTGFDTWAAANDLAAELPEGFGALNTPYPDAPLVVTAPGEESGTYDSFLELALAGIAEERGQDAVARPDYTASPNDNVIVEGIAGTDTSLGWVGYAFVEANLDAVKPLAVDGGDGCVEPTTETIASGEFPLSRPLFIYISTNKLEENPALGPFVDYYLSDEGIASVSGVGYVDLADADLEATRAAWDAKETGTREG